MDFDDFGENSTISRFRFSGTARGDAGNARAQEIFADVWSRSVRFRRVDISRTSILLEIDAISRSCFMGVLVWVWL